MEADDARRATIEGLLEKLQVFISELDDLEREALAALLAPGIAAAFEDQELQGFSTARRRGWIADRLPEHLAEAISEQRLRIVVESRRGHPDQAQ